MSSIINSLDSGKTKTPKPSFFETPYPHYWLRWDYEESDRQAFRIDRDKEMSDLRIWWIQEMLATQKPAAEKLVMLWHNHFVSAYSGVDQNVHAIGRQHWALRQHGHTNFEVLARAMIHDAAMLDYLDNDRSRKESPNENLARELLELFVLGEGNYTEETVKEVARALTGYRSNTLRQHEFQFSHWDHDTGRKNILGRRGRFDGDDDIDILLDQPETALFIASKFWKEYISDFNVDPEQLGLIADAFRNSNYDIKMLMRATLSSTAFWAEQNRATIVKSPIDFLIGTIRSTGVLPDWWSSLPNKMSVLGQNIFEPPNVGGWSGGADWISPSRLL